MLNSVRGIQTAAASLPVVWAKTFHYHKRQISGLAVHPDGRLVSGSDDGTIKLKDLSSENAPSIMKGLEETVTSLNLYESSWLFGVGCGDNQVRLWDMQGNLAGHLVAHKNTVTSTYGMFHPGWKSAMIISASVDHTIKVWDSRHADRPRYELRESQKSPAHSGPIYSMIRCNESRMASGSEDGSIRVWNPFEADIRRQLLKTISVGQAVSALVFCPKRKILVSGSENSTRIDVWDLSDLTRKDLRISSFNAPASAGGVSSLALFPSGEIASGQMSGDILIWNPEDGTNPLLGTLPKKHELKVTALTTLPGGSLASGSREGIINWWTSS